MILYIRMLYNTDFIKILKSFPLLLFCRTSTLERVTSEAHRLLKDVSKSPSSPGTIGSPTGTLSVPPGTVRSSEAWKSPKTLRKKRYSPEIEKALEGIKFIADHMKEDDCNDKVR